jgi:hypothetical protein
VRRQASAIALLVLAALACGQYVTPTPAAIVPSPPPSATPSPTRTPRATATSEDVQTIAVVRQAFVNIRTEPDGAVIGYVEAGQRVVVIECQGSWCLIRANDVDGWIWRGCLEEYAEERKCEAR